MRRKRWRSSALWWVLNGPRRGAAGQPLQDRRFQLDVAALVHVLADRRQHLRAHLEDLARALVRHQVELALAVADLGVGDPVEEVGRVAQRLGEQRALAHRERQLAALGHVEVALDPDDVADVEVLDPPEGLLAERVDAGRRPGSCPVRSRTSKKTVLPWPRLPVTPAGDPVGELRVLALPQLGRVVGGEDLLDPGAVREGARDRGRSLPRAAARPWPGARPRSSPASRLGLRARHGAHWGQADRHPLAAHVVGQRGRVLEHLPHRRPVVGVVLEGHPPAGRHLGEHAADHAEAVLAAVAGDGDPRLALDLRRALEDRRVGDVGKVGEDEVDLLRRRLVGQALLDRDLEVEAEPLGVLAGGFGRLGREVGGGHPQVGPLG